MKFFIVAVIGGLFNWTMGYIAGFRNADDVEFRQAIKEIKNRLRRK